MNLPTQSECRARTSAIVDRDAARGRSEFRRARRMVVLRERCWRHAVVNCARILTGLSEQAVTLGPSRHRDRARRGFSRNRIINNLAAKAGPTRIRLVNILLTIQRPTGQCKSSTRPALR